MFHWYASEILPLTIREKLCDNPHETHGSPVSFSCIQTIGYLSLAGEKKPEYAKTSRITPVRIIFI